MLAAVFRGLAMGALYGVLAMSVALLHRTTGALSFAHGEIGGFAALAAIAAISAGVPWAGAALLALAVAAAIGAAFHLLIGRRIPGDRPGTLTVATVGLLLLLLAAAQKIWGVYPRSLPAPIDARGIDALGALVAPTQLVALAAGIGGAVLLTLVLRRTSIGLATLAAAHDRTEAALLGVPVAGIAVGVWTTTAVLAAVAALLFGPVVGAIGPGTMTLFFLRSIAAVTIGGTATMWGPVLGGLTVGVVEQVAVKVLLHSGIPGVDVLAVLALLVIALAARTRTAQVAL